jgi:kinetochore protein Spc25
MEIATLKSQTHAQAVAKESAETAEMHAQMATLRAHRDDARQRRAELQRELDAAKSTLAARCDAEARRAAYLSSQARWNGPELRFWEEYLCMRIEGAGRVDRLKFVFSHICEKDWEREAWFELDTSDREYKVLKTGPRVDKGDVDACLDRLNESRELGPFFKGMRDIFVRAMK